MEETRICQNCTKDFVIESEDFNFYEKIKVPPPTFCPECRFVRRLCFRNERSLHKRTCDLCKKKIISVYETNVNFPVYCPECWRSDKWEALEYGQEYDFNKPFFTQWKELFTKVPRQSVWQFNCIDCEYANLVQNAKNVYLSYSVVYNTEDVFYSSNVDISKIIVDSYNVSNSELIYQSIGSAKNYNCQYTYWSSSCVDCNFILDCVNCSNCFGCVNLRNKQYCIWNEQYSQEEYFTKLKNFNMGSYTFVTESFPKFWDFTLKFPRKYAKIANSINSIGDELRNCKNAFFAFNAYDAEDIKFAYRSFKIKNSMDFCHLGVNTEMAYEHGFGGSENSSNIKFVLTGAPALNEVEYVDLSQSSNNLFGCIGLRSKKYCILNKQYEKEEYQNLVEKIKKHMDEMPYIDTKGRIYKYGEFFPFEFSPFGYNETLINDLYPLSEKETKEKGYNWKEKVENKYTITKKAEDIPDDIKNVDDSILNEIIECEVTKKPFKITPFELQFYRRMNIPIPRIHQDERCKRRIALKNPLKLWHRKCMCGKTDHFHEGSPCENEFETSYAPDRPEIVYCERCYQQEVY